MKTADDLLSTLGRDLVDTIAPYWNGTDAGPLNEAIATVILAVLNSHNAEVTLQANGDFACQLGTSMREVQRQYAFQALLQLKGNKARTARMLGIDRGSLSRLLEGGPTPRFQRPISKRCDNRRL